jgi:hypothetical protein
MEKETGGACGSHGIEMKCLGDFVKAIRGNEFTQRRPNRRRVDNTKVGVKQLGYLGLDGSNFSADKKKWQSVAKWVMKVRVLSTVGNFFKS